MTADPVFDQAKTMLAACAINLHARGEDGRALETLRAWVGLHVAERVAVERLSEADARALNAAHLAITGLIPYALHAHSNAIYTLVRQMVARIEDTYALTIEDTAPTYRALVALSWRAMLNAKHRGERLSPGALAFIVAGTTAPPTDDLQDWLYQETPDGPRPDHRPAA